MLSSHEGHLDLNFLSGIYLSVMLLIPPMTKTDFQGGRHGCFIHHHVPRARTVP